MSSPRRAVAAAAFSALVAVAAACSSGGTRTRADWRTENAYGSEMARKGFWREALFRYRRAAELRPQDAQIENNLAVAYESVGDTARALAAYRHALELAPEDAKIKRNYARFAEYYTSVQRASSLPAPSSSAEPGPAAPGPASPAPAATPAPGEHP